MGSDDRMLQCEIRMTEAFGLSDVGCVRSNNEDCYRIENDLGLYLLADGMGGANAGERASEVAVETVASPDPRVARARCRRAAKSR